METSLRSRVSIAMWAMVAISIVATMLITSKLLINSYHESTRQQIESATTSLITLGITDFSELEDFEEMNRFVESTLQMDRMDKIIRIYDRNKNLIFSTAGSDYDTLPNKLSGSFDKPRFMTIAGERRNYESLVMPYKGGGQKTFYLQVAIPLLEYSKILDNLWTRGFLILVFLLCASLIIAHVLSKKLLTPVEAISNHLRNMDPTAVESWKPFEIDPRGRYLQAIVDGINNLARRTKSAMFNLRNMSQYIAHELRTPLTVLRGEAEVALLKKDLTIDDCKSTIRSSLEEIHKMEVTVDTVMQINGTSKKNYALKFATCDLNKWVGEHIGYWEKVIGRPISFNSFQGDGSAKIDTNLLFHLIDNLIRNVKKHTPQDSKCSLTLANRDGTSSLSIEDEGPGMSDEMLATLNNAQFSTEAHCGVGLSLCLRIAELCGFKLQFRNRHAGGLHVEIGQL